MYHVRLDAVAALRAIRRDWWPSLSVSLVLGTALGLATTVFALGDRFVTRPLPYPKPHELLLVGLSRDTNRRPLAPRPSLPTVEDWSTRSDLFQGVGWLDPISGVQRAHSDSGDVVFRAARVSRSAMEILGRFVPTCGFAGCVLLTSANGSRQDLTQLAGRGALETLSGGTFQAVGTLPVAFVLPRLQLDAVFVPDDQSTPDLASVMLIARRRPDTSSESIRSALQDTLPDGVGYRVRVEPLDAVMTQLNRSTAIAALCAAVLLLVVSVGSTSNLLFARAMGRLPDIMTRRALGATFADIARLLIWEVGFLTATAVATGTTVASFVVAALAQVAPTQYLTLGRPTVSLREIAFASVSGTAVIGLSSGLSWLVLRRTPRGTLGRPVPPSGRVGRLLRCLTVATQSALAMLFMAGSVVLGRSYFNLFSQATGVSNDTVVAEVSYPSTVTSGQLGDEVERSMDRLRHLSNVQAVGLADGPLFIDLRSLGCCVSVDDNVIDAQSRRVTADFFRAVGATIVLGRPLATSDVNLSSSVVTESFARVAWPGQNPIGRTMKIGSGSTVVVGVVRDMFTGSLDRPTGPTVYSLLERPTTIPCLNCETPMTFVIKPSGDIEHLNSAVRRALSYGVAAVADVSTARDRLTRSVAERTFVSIVTWSYGVAATSICIGGVVGVVGAVIRRRAKELAIRAAIGAGPGRLIQTVSAETFFAAVVGVCLGVFASHVLVGSLRHFVYGVEPGSWSQMIVTGLIMLLIVTIPILGIGRRAARISPGNALKDS